MAGNVDQNDALRFSHGGPKNKQQWREGGEERLHGPHSVGHVQHVNLFKVSGMSPHSQHISKRQQKTPSVT